MIRTRNRRRGAVLPIVAVCLVGLMGFIALAIDIGMMVVARSQCQNAADVAALAGARTLDGKSANNNLSAATSMAVSAATANTVLNAPIAAAQVTAVNPGIYRYDSTANRFQAVFGQAPGSTEAYGVMQVQINTQQATVFANIFGIQSLNVGAVATAVHRPRDVAVVLDFSWSMGYCSHFSYPDYTPVTGSLNPDSRFPTFGPWSIWGGPGMVLDPNNPPATPGDLTNYVPPTPMQRAFTYVDGGGETRAANNLTTDTRNGPAMVNNFLLSDNATPAFVSSYGSFPSFTNVNVSTTGNPTGIVTPAPATFANQNASGFVGDKFPLRSGVTGLGTNAPTPDQYAQTVADYLGITRSSVTASTRNATFEANGYDWDFAAGSLKPASQRFQGFTVGPGYYGKTFYMWPPDPRTPVNNIGDSGYVAGDWRQRFFKPRSGSAQDPHDNSMFWSANGRWKAQNPGSTANYMVNYDAVLAWLKRGPQVLPTSLRSGRVVYFDAIPDTIPVDQTTGLITSSATADQCFWKDYIDFVLGAGRYTDSGILYGANSSNANTRAGANLCYNSPSNTSLLPQITPRSVLLSANGGNPANTPYISYTDNPVHPRAQFWFGPLSMLGYFSARVNYFPGTSYEAPCWQLKVGIKAALDDIKNNHPNDLASLIYFSGSLSYNTPRVSMGKDFTRMQNALFYPFPLLDSLGVASSSVRPFNLVGPDPANPAGLADNTDPIPNANSSTCPQMAFMLAYNEFGWASGNNTTYKGRHGASKVVIFETDGVPNVTCNGGLSGGNSVGTYYYSGINGVTWNDTSLQLHVPPKDQARAVVKQIVALETDNPPGFSTTRNPARVHAIAFGELFEPSTPSTMKPAALRFLAAVQIDGRTSQPPAGSWDDDSLDYNSVYVNREPYKVIVGDYNTRIDKLRQALQRIMQGGIQVALIQ
jgi:hypothetical protein